MGSRLPPASGGVPRHLQNLAEGLSETGCEVDVLLCNESRRGRTDFGHLYSPPAQSIRGLVTPFSLRWFARNHWSYDIVHFHGISNPNNLLLVALAERPGIVFSPHFHSSTDSRLGRTLRGVYLSTFRAISHRVHSWIAVSDHEARLLNRTLGVSPDRIQTIPPAVARGFTPNNSQARSKTIRKTPMLLYVGLLSPHKNVDGLLHTVKLLKEDGINVRARIVGYGPEETRLKAKCSSLGVAGEIQWIRRANDEKLRRYYQDSDFLLLPSSQEAYGLVVAEALLLGTPVLLSSCEALHEWDGVPGAYETGCPFSAHEAAHLIRSLLGRRVKIGHLGGKTMLVGECAAAHADSYARILQDS